MDRKAEKILTWIGFGIQAFITLILTLFFVLIMIGASQEASLDSDETLGLVFIIIAAICAWVMLIVAIIAGIKINKSPKGAGITLIVIGALNLFFNFISGILWLIAGILLLTRKPNPEMAQYNDKQPYDTTNGQHVYHDHPNQQTQQHNRIDDLTSEQQNKDQDPYKY